MIRFDAVSVRYGVVPALQDVSLQIDSGEVVLLAGASGCGKSTLLRAASGLIPHASPAALSGDVWLAGRRTADRTLRELAFACGLVFQNPSTQLFNQRVDDEVAFGPRHAGLDRPEIDARTAWALERTGLADKAGRDVRSLSGGERQRVALAGVLAMRPAVLALDEPMASLDVEGTRRLVDVLAHVRREYGTTVVMAEHRLREAASTATRAVLLEAGRVVADGAADTVMGDRQTLRALGLRRPAVTPQAEWETLIGSGRAEGGSTLVELRGVDASYGGDAVVRGLDLDLREGECVALVGDNGSGKSTVARVLAGLLSPVRGSVRWVGGTPDPGRDVAILLQEPREQLFCESVGEELSFGPQNLGMDASAGIDTIIEAADLAGLLPRPLHTLSHGQLHRTALAAVLAQRPRVLILDEPTAGQDWRHLDRLMGAVDTLRRAGSAVLLVSHDFKLIHRHATRLVLLRHGQVAAEGVPAGSPGDGDDR